MGSVPCAEGFVTVPSLNCTLVLLATATDQPLAVTLLATVSTVQEIPLMLRMFVQVGGLLTDIALG